MKRFAVIVMLSLTTLVSTITPAQAQAVPGLAIPIVSADPDGVFNGVFNLQRFVVTRVGGDRVVAAVGTLTGTLTTAAGQVVSIARNVVVPVQAAQATCQVLHLDLGPLFLDVLGVQVDLSQVILDVTAVGGSGRLLGNLVCAVAGLLDPGGLLDAPLGVVAGLLNQILGILG